MTISELIEALEKIRETEGDIEVRIQFRDDGGDYVGTDECVDPSVEEWYEHDELTRYVLL